MINNFALPADVQLNLFDNTVLPKQTYASEAWEYTNNEIIDRVHTEFLRKKYENSKKHFTLHVICRTWQVSHPDYYRYPYY